MNDFGDIPKPDESGSSGEQLPSADAQLVASSPLNGLPLADTIQGLAATKYRGMGGEVVAALLAGATSQMSQELQRAKGEIDTLRENQDKAVSDLSP